MQTWLISSLVENLLFKVYSTELGVHYGELEERNILSGNILQ